MFKSEIVGLNIISVIVVHHDIVSAAGPSYGKRQTTERYGFNSMVNLIRVAVGQW
jgi:hypothetical protein